MSPISACDPVRAPARWIRSPGFRTIMVAMLLLAAVGLAIQTPDKTSAVMLGPGTFAFGATMFGTAEGDGLVGDTTSSGYRMRPYDRVVALPACTRSSCPWLDAGANKNGHYGAQTMCAESDGHCWVEITSVVTGRCAVAPVRDLGPLFARDNWWEATSDRTYPSTADNRPRR